MGALISYVNFYKDIKTLVTNYFCLIIGAMIFDVLICGLLYYSYGDLGSLKHSLFAWFFMGSLILTLSHKVEWYCRVLRVKIINVDRYNFLFVVSISLFFIRLYASHFWK